MGMTEMGQDTSAPRACIVRYQANDKAVMREAEALRDAGYSVDVLVLRSKKGDARSVVVGDVRYDRMPLSKRRSSPFSYAVDWGLWFLFCFAWLAKETPRRRFAYVQVDTLPDHQVFTALVPKLFGAKIGLFLKEPTKELYGALWGSQRVASLMGWVARRSINFADVVFCVTDEHRQSYIDAGIDSSKLSVVLNSMPPFPKAARSRPQNDGAFVVLCHGTIEDRWGHDTIIDAVAHAIELIPGLRLHLPGRGDSVPRLQKKIDDLGLSSVITLDGWLSDEDLAQLLADADVGVVAQVANPYSHLVHTTKMYDFMEASVPVVATRLRATEALFPTEITYVESEDAEAMAAAFVALSADPDRRQRQASDALNRMATLGWKPQMEAMVAAIGPAH